MTTGGKPNALAQAVSFRQKPSTTYNKYVQRSNQRTVSITMLLLFIFKTAEANKTITFIQVKWLRMRDTVIHGKPKWRFGKKIH